MRGGQVVGILVLAEVLLLARKDLRIERRAKVAVAGSALTLLIVVVFAFALDANAPLLEIGAGGLIVAFCTEELCSPSEL